MVYCIMLYYIIYIILCYIILDYSMLYYVVLYYISLYFNTGSKANARNWNQKLHYSDLFLEVIWGGAGPGRAFATTFSVYLSLYMRFVNDIVGDYVNASQEQAVGYFTSAASALYNNMCHTKWRHLEMVSFQQGLNVERGNVLKWDNYQKLLDLQPFIACR